MIVIDQAVPADAAEIASLIAEIKAYYGSDDTPGVDDIRAALFGDRPVASVLLAREGDVVVGMASFTFLWPAAGTARRCISRSCSSGRWHGGEEWGAR